MDQTVDRFPTFDSLNLPVRLRRDLRSDHAGETGAVAIYRGILRFCGDPEVRSFAQHHLITEKRHLEFFEDWLPARYHSLALPLWRLAGYLLGAIPALMGPRWVFVTIDAVETFVVQHYEAQLERMPAHSSELARVLEQFQADEDHHRQDAFARYLSDLTAAQRLWQKAIDTGSRAAVVLARLI